MPTYNPTAAPTTHWYSTPITASTNYGFSAIALSNDGSCVTVGATDGITLFARQSTTGTFTQWTSTVSSINPFTSISMSISGQYQVALNGNTFIYLSSNSGVSWTSNNAEVLNYNGVGWKFSAMSNDGYTIFLSQATSATFAIYAGSSSIAWNPLFTISQPMTGISIAGIAMNSAGSVFACMSTSGIVFVSHNQGNLWTQMSTTTFATNLMTMSGSNLMTVVAAVAGINSLEYSSNQGNVFTSVDGPGAPTNIWISLASSYSGQYIIGAMEHGQYDTSTSQDGIYFSSNQGQSWDFVQPMDNAVVGSNPAGNYFVAVSGDIGTTQLYYYTQAGKCFHPSY